MTIKKFLFSRVSDSRFPNEFCQKKLQKKKKSSELLAADALALMDRVWPGRPPVHVFGASMGGFVAQVSYAFSCV